MEKFLSLSVDGLVSGAIFSLFATGLVLTYSTSGIFNFAHGATAFVTALVYFELNSGLGWPIVPAALVAILVFAPLFGVLLERLLFRDLARADETAKIVGTVGLLVALPALATWIVDRLVTTFHLGIADLQNTGLVPGLGPTPSQSWELFSGVRINSNQVVVLAAAAVAAFGLWLLVGRTRLGLGMRAVVDRRDLASLRGVDPARTSTIAWLVGTLLAGLAGVAAGPLFGLVADSFTTFLIVSATAVVLARFRSLPGAFFGGLLVGLAANLVAGYAGFSSVLPGLRTSAPFIFLFVGLYVLARSRERATGSAASDVPPPDHLADLPRWRRALPWAVATALLVTWILGLVPVGSFEAGRIELGLIIRGLAFGLVFMSFVVVTGIGGMVSLAQAAFVVAGAMTAGLLMDGGMPWLPAAIVGALSATVLGVVVALPALRLGGVALALATLAIAFIGEHTLFKIDAYRNQSFGWSIPRPEIGPFDFSDDKSLAMLVLLVVGLVALLVRNLQRSASGRAMVAVRSAEVAAASSGVSPVMAKLALFALSAFVAGLGGVMLATEAGTIRDTSFFPIAGLFWLTVTVVFGVRRPGGAVVAGMVTMLFPRVLHQGFLFVPGTDSTQIPMILFGLAAIQLARNPDGVLALVGRQHHERRRRRRARRAAADAPEPIEEPVEEPVEEVTADVVAEQEVPARDSPRAAETPTAALPDTTDEGFAGALEVRGLRAGYGDVEVLHGVDLSVRTGEIAALLGPNGAGKSTFCSAVAGLLPASSGTVALEGDDVTGRRAHERARLGLVLAPESRGIFPALTVEENLDLWLAGDSEKEAVYDRFGHLAARRDLAAGSLSGGEQQMLTLAPLLVRPPRVLVADEPTLGLAPLVVVDLLEVFRELRDQGTALLLVEEKTRNVLEIADRVAFLSLGRIAWAGPRSELDEHDMAARYLGAVATP